MPFRLAIMDFWPEQVTLAETKATIESTLKLVEDESLRVGYAAFLDAPLDTDEQQATARAALCQIFGPLGGISTTPFRKNLKLVEELIRKISSNAEACWIPEQRRKFVSFMVKFLFPKEADEEKQKRRDPLEMATSERSLQELLTTLWQELDNYGKDEGGIA